MNRTIPRVAAISAGLVVFAATLGGGIVLAQSNDSPAAPDATQQAQTDTPPAGQDPKVRMEEFIKNLATNLRIGEQTLKDALKTTATAEVDKALQDGKIDQATADRIRAAIANGEGGFGPVPLGRHGAGPQGGMNGGRGPLGGPGMGVGAANEIATFLGTDAKTVRDELGSGKTLAEVAEAHRKSRSELKAFLTSEMDTHLKEQVTSGRLTEAQADALRGQADANIEKMLDSKGPMGLAGPGGPKHGRPGMQSPQGATPSTTN